MFRGPWLHCIISFSVWIIPTSTCMMENKREDVKAIEMILSFLSDLKSTRRDTANKRRQPFVTLSYAQSLDGKIGVFSSINQKSSNYPISSKESLVLTHALRSAHDAVLVGSGTMKSDNPRLNVRLWHLTKNQEQPRPVLLDTRMSFASSLVSCKAQNLIVCCDIETAAAVEDGMIEIRDDWTIIGCKSTANKNGSKLNIQDVLQKLYIEQGIRSLMVEGGASIINEFSRTDEVSSISHVDAVVITIAPKIIGIHGIPVFDRLLTKGQERATEIVDPKFTTVGKDCILYGTWPSTLRKN